MPKNDQPDSCQEAQEKAEKSLLDLQKNVQTLERQRENDKRDQKWMIGIAAGLLALLGFNNIYLIPEDLKSRVSSAMDKELPKQLALKQA